MGDISTLIAFIVESPTKINDQILVILANYLYCLFRSLSHSSIVSNVSKGHFATASLIDASVMFWHEEISSNVGLGQFAAMAIIVLAGRDIEQRKIRTVCGSLRP